MLRAWCSLALLFLFATTSSALHFYLDLDEKRCFIEELPTDTVVEGHYRAQEWHEEEQQYKNNPSLGISISVDEMETGTSIVNTRGPPEGRFTFTSHDSGDHSICLAPHFIHQTWFSPSSHIRFYLDIVVGNTRPDVDHDRSHISEIAGKVRDLNTKLEDIRREQQYQREREADFRDLSEATNSKAVWYSIAQIVVLVLTCAWQLRHLKHFFDDRKMR